MLSYFAIKFASSDWKGFLQALRKFDTNGVIVVWNYAGRIQVEQCPPAIQLKRSYSYFTPGSWNENRWIKWSSFCVIMTWIMLRVFTQTKVKRFFVGGGDILLWVAQIFLVFGRIEMTATTIEDWSLILPQDNFYARLTKIKQRLNDFLLNHMDTRVIVTSKEMFDARNRRWNDKSVANSVLLEHVWAWFIDARRSRPLVREGNHICLLGTMRRGFSVPALFQILAELNAQHGIRLKIIGPENELCAEFREMVEHLGVADLIDWRGFVSDEALDGELANCFCGLNVHEFAHNDHSNTAAGRVVHYMQNYLVPIVSPYSGVLVSVIRDYQLGIVCLSDSESLKAAILQAHSGALDFAVNIERFFTQNPYRIEARQLLGA